MNTLSRIRQFLSAQRLHAVEKERAGELSRLLDQERKRSRQLALLADVARRLANLQAPQALMEETIRQLRQEFGFEHVGLLLVEGDELVVRAAHSRSGAVTPGLRLPLGQGVIGYVAQTGRPYLVEDTYADERYVRLLGADMLSELVVPLRLGDHVIGVLNIESERRQAFDATDVSTLESLADLLAASLQAGRLFSEVHARERLAETLRRVGLAVTASLDLSTVLETVCAETTRLFGADGAVVWLLEGEDLHAAAAIGLHTESLVGLRTPVAEPTFVSGRAMRERRSIAVHDLQRSADGQPHLKRLSAAESLLAAPLVMGDQPLGALTIFDTQPQRRFDEQDIAAAELLGAQAATAIHNTRLYAESRRQARELAGLYDTALATSGVLDLQALLERLHAHVSGLMNPDTFAVALYHAEGDELEVALAVEDGRRLSEARGMRLPAEEAGLTGWVLRSRQSLLVGDILNDPLPAQPRHVIRPARAWLGVPLLAREAVIGAISVQSFRAGAFGEADRRYLESIAGQVAAALDNARLFESERRRAAQLGLLEEVSRQVASTLDRDEIYRRATAALVERFGYSQAAVMVPIGGEALELAASAGTADLGVTPGFRQRFDQGVIGRAAQTRATYLAADIGADPYYFSPAARTVGSALAVPLVREDELLAVLYVESDSPNAFGPEDVRALETLGAQVAAAIDNARLYESERRRAQQMAFLNDITRAGLETADLHQMLQTLADRLGALIDADGCFITLWDEARQQVIPVAAYSELRQTYAAIQIEPGETTMTQSVLQAGQALVVEDVFNTPYLSPRIAAMFPSRSLLGLPLIAAGQKLGAALIAFNQPHQFTKDEIAIGEQAAGQIALAIAKTRLIQSEQEQRQLADALREVGAALSESLDFDAVLDRMLEQVGRVVPYDAAGVMLVDSEAKRVQVVRARGYEQFGAVVARDMESLAFDIATTANLRRMAETRQPYWVPDTGADPDWLRVEATAHLHSWAGAPLVAQGRVIAFFSLDKAEPGFYRAEHAERLGAFAAQAGLAMQNARLYEQIHRRAGQLAALNNVGRAVSALQDVDGVLTVIYEQVRRSLPVDAFFVALYEQATGTLSFPVVYDEGRRYEQAAAPLLKHTTLARTIATAAPRLINRTPEQLAGLQGPPARLGDIGDASRLSASIMYAPLIVGPRVIGVISVQSYSLNAYTQEHLEFLTGVAHQAAIAIENARLYTDSRRREGMLEALYTTSLEISAPHELPALLRAIVERAVRLLNAEEGGLDLCDPARQVLEREYDTEPAYIGTTIRYGEGAAGTVAATGRLLNIADYRVWPGRLPAAKPGHRAQAWEFVSLLSAPLVWQGQVTGVLDIRRVSPDRPFTHEDEELLTLFAAQAAAALENRRLYEAAQRHTAEQRLLFDATRDFTAGLAEDEVLQAIGRHMTSVVRAPCCAISLLDRDGDRVVTLLDYAADPCQVGLVPKGVAFALDDYPLTRRVLETGQPVHLRADDPRADPAERALLEEYGDGVLLMLPLVTGDRPFGLLELFREPSAPDFSEDEVRLAQSLAAQAAVALENARLHAAEIKRARELAALLTANAALLSTLELDSLLHNILTAAIGAVPAAEKGAILLWDEAEEQLRIRAIAGYSDPRVRTLAFAGERSYSAQAMREQQPVLVADARADRSVRYDGEIAEVREILSGIAVPLMLHGSPLGVISLDSTQRAAFSGEDLNLLVAFANTAAIAIDHARLHAEVQTLAVTDPLTGLANRRAFDRALEIEVPRAARYAHPLSLIIFDLDDFKVFNDTYGHPAGDERLKAIADLLRDKVRDPDLAARYGGEEFALILPHTGKAGAQALAERIRAAAEAAAPREPAKPRRGGRAVPPVPGYTLSLGVATLADDADTAAGLLRAADEAELTAKRQGKNRVCVAPGAFST